MIITKKVLIPAIIAVVLAFSLVGCGNKDNNEAESTTETTSATETTTDSTVDTDNTTGMMEDGTVTDEDGIIGNEDESQGDSLMDDLEDMTVTTAE